jgi:hypothetical protein
MFPAFLAARFGESWRSGSGDLRKLIQHTTFVVSAHRVRIHCSADLTNSNELNEEFEQLARRDRRRASLYLDHLLVPKN